MRQAGKLLSAIALDVPVPVVRGQTLQTRSVNVRLSWLECENNGKKVPKWMMTVGVSDTGLVFVPAAITGREQEVFLCAAYDGTPYASYRNHVFVPSTWLAAEFPDCRDLCEAMEKWVQIQIDAGVLDQSAP